MEDIRLKQNIIEVEIDKITPYEGSHKTDASIELIKESIKDFGINQPITVDKDYVVVTGNGVFKAAKELGMATIPVIVLDDLSDEEIKQYRIADDKTQEFATWNEKKLRKELSYLQDPTSLQSYFDQDIVGMLGLNSKVKPLSQVLPQNDGQQQVAETAKAMTKPEPTEAEKDAAFKQGLKNIDDGMLVRPSEYIEYTCSKCGRTVRVKAK
jgi:ParB-like chromosome segregation protein Spo0J